MKQYIAVDLGAESGRVMLGSVGVDKLILEEIHRFSNKPVEEAGTLRWDFNNILSEVKTGIAKATKQAEGKIGGIGIDSWGVDFGLIDSNGTLIENPYHYRDGRTAGVMEKAYQLMPKRQIYENTGLQFLQFNTIYQLLAAQSNSPNILAKAHKLVFIADLLTYFLCGRIFAEYTMASTSQLMDMRSGRWSKAIFDKISLPIEIMPEIVKPGTIVGELADKLCQELDCGPTNIITVASHDTASAVAAVPAANDNWAYISSGTWSLMGVERAEPIINDRSFKYSFTNEGGVENTICFLKNIMGLWIVQECKRQWHSEGVALSYAELAAMAENARPFVAYIDPDRVEFLSPGNIPDKINSFLSKTGQKTIDNKGQMIRAILEGLAFKYRWVLEKIEQVTSSLVDCLHIVGGGIRNELLCRFTANAVGKRLLAGPIEAAAIGNILTQAKAAGQIENLAQAREMIRNSFELKDYQAKDTSIWEEEYEKFKAATGL